MNFSNDHLMNLIWLHSMRVSWSVYELFSQPSYKPHWVTVHENILVSQWTFQMIILWTSFGHIPWEYLGQSMNFLANPRINLIGLLSMRISWSANELFKWTSYEPHLVTFHESILVSLWTFQSTIVEEVKKTIQNM